MAGTVDLSVIESSKVQNRFTERFARNGDVVNADAANAGGAIDNRRSLAKLSTLDCGLLASGTGTDDCQFVLPIHSCNFFSP
jgi:hypothetical protein